MVKYEVVEKCGYFTLDFDFGKGKFKKYSWVTLPFMNSFKTLYECIEMADTYIEFLIEHEQYGEMTEILVREFGKETKGIFIKDVQEMLSIGHTKAYDIVAKYNLQFIGAKKIDPEKLARLLSTSRFSI
jgi:hypothetical protein